MSILEFFPCDAWDQSFLPLLDSGNVPEFDAITKHPHARDSGATRPYCSLNSLVVIEGTITASDAFM